MNFVNLRWFTLISNFVVVLFSLQIGVLCKDYLSAVFRLNLG
jgi:hypothetical protein